MSGKRPKGNDADAPSLFDDAFWDAPAKPIPLEAFVEQETTADEASDAPSDAAPDATAGASGAPAAPAGPRAAAGGNQRRRGRTRVGVRADDVAADRVESRARARALQALYAADMRGGDLRRIALQVWDDLGIDPEERTFASVLVERVVRDQATLDADLTAVTANWRLERLGAIERSVLRLAAAELGIETQPPRVVLQEAVRLAERYGTPKSARFVNGVLDAYARRIGRL